MSKECFGSKGHAKRESIATLLDLRFWGLECLPYKIYYCSNTAYWTGRLRGELVGTSPAQTFGVN